MREEIISLRSQATAAIMDAHSEGELETIKLQYLGKQGLLKALFKKVATLDPDEKKATGSVINETIEVLETMIGTRRQALKAQAAQSFDETIPGIVPPMGHLHLMTQAIEGIAAVFERAGFVRRRYPEVEYDWFSFGSLNFNDDHPARDDWETFFVEAPSDPQKGPMLLTPHTSSGQVREMLRVGSTPPIRMINISKTYRRQTDVSHVPMFHQFEGLVVDRGISIVHLKGTLDYFVQNYFGKNAKTRLRPYHFPFTEPSFEVDMSCNICGGVGCKLCKEGWLELGGAGMVHPHVLKSGGIDPTKYTGFAFGWGIERTFMMASGVKIPDVRILYSGDLRYLTQF